MNLNKNIICLIAAILTILFLTVMDSRGQFGFNNVAMVGSFTATTTSSGGGGSSSTLNTNLVNFWKMEETGASSRVDEKGNDNLTANGTPSSAAGKLGNACAFNGSSQYLSHAYDAVLELYGTNWTVAFWAYLDNKTTSQSFVSMWDSNLRYFVRYHQNNDRFSAVTYDGGTVYDLQATNHGSPSTAGWNFIVVSHDDSANTLRIRVNNGTADTLTVPSLNNNGTVEFEVGARGGGGTERLTGRVDALGIWKKTLTTTEEAELYNSGTGREYPF